MRRVLTLALAAVLPVTPLDAPPATATGPTGEQTAPSAPPPQSTRTAHLERAARTQHPAQAGGHPAPAARTARVGGATQARRTVQTGGYATQAAWIAQVKGAMRTWRAAQTGGRPASAERTARVVKSGPGLGSAPAAGAGRAAVGARTAHIGATAGLLYDATAGRTLWARRSRVRRPIGSIAKVMTALVVLHEGRLDRKIQIKARHRKYSDSRGGSSAALRVGDRISARELLYALLLPSGCDAAAALADAYGPGPKRFLAKMNALARAFGLTDTDYRDAAGLPPHPGASTARDQVVLARRALRSRTFARIVRQTAHVLPGTRDHRRYVWRTTNALLGTYPGMTGIKTGYTKAAGYSLLFSARRRGRTLIGIVLNSRARFVDARKALNWGFARRSGRST